MAIGISDVTTVGTNTTGRGPLSSLYQKGGLPIYRYPSDLTSEYKSHYVEFCIQQIIPKFFDDSSATASSKAEAATFAQSQTTALENTVGQNTNPNRFNIYDQQTRKAISYIQLFIPDTMNFQYNASYGEVSLKEAAESLPLLGNAFKAGASLLTNKASRLLLSSAGLTFNPNQQLLFEGIDFRTFQMAFTFTPASEQEHNQVKNIIKTFRQHAAPTINQKSYGMFFIPPSLFKITFYSNGSENIEIPKVKDCVIKDIDVNYAPNGWAAHKGGAPVQTVVTMTFQETSLLDSQDIYDGH